MIPEEQHTAYIVEAWNSMTTKRDLLALLNYAKPLAHGAKTEPFKLKQLSWYSHPRLNRARYTTFTIKKRSGGERIINAPVKTLKSIQKTLAYILQCIYEPQDPAKGFVRGRSIVDNARIHQAQNYVYNIDLKDFFPSIEQARVWKCLQLYPFGLNAKKSSHKPQMEHQGSRLATLLGMKPGVFNLAGRGIPQYIKPKKTNQERISELTTLKENIHSAPEIKFIRKSVFKVIGQRGYEQFKKSQDELELSEKIEFEPGSSFAVIRDKVDKYLLPLYIDSLINALLGISPSHDLSSINTEYLLDGQVVQQYSLGRHGKISFRASQSNEGNVEVTLENFQEAIEAAVLASFNPAAVLNAEDILKIHEQYDATEDDVTHLLKSFPLTIHAHICKQLGISPNIKPEPREESVNLVAPRVRLASIIGALCCTEMEVTRQKGDKEYAVVKRNVLPQGAPTSPVISNIVCRKLDHRLSGLARRFGLQYSRYADDITFSSMHNVYNADSEFLKELNRIITDQRFQINQTKTRLQKEGYRQEVTGLIVNEKVNVQRRYVKELRMWLYYWERYGYERAYRFFLQQYAETIKSGSKGQPDMFCVISGKLDYLRMVKGAENEQYLKLESRLEKIIAGNEPSKHAEMITKRGQGRFRGMLQGVLERRKGEVLEHAIAEKEEVTGHSGKSNVVPELAAPPNALEQSVVPYKNKPRVLIQLLSLFSENRHPLKYACHSWDYGKVEDVFESYSDFIHQFDERGRSICFEIQKLKRTLGTKVLHFLNTPNENGKYFLRNERRDYSWGQHGMRYGWKSQELAEWARQHPELDPFEFPLPNKIVIRKGNRDVEISRFGDVVKIFKDEIEVRAEDMALYNMFAELRRKHLGFDFTVKLDDNLKGKQFYTDVHEFKRALNKVFMEIGKRTAYPNVDISAVNYTDEGHTLIEIVHHHSFCYDKSSDEMIAEVKDGDFGDVLGYLENLCDWSIDSKFSDGCYRINYLSASEAALAKENMPSSEGFRHTFKFYKT
jgi:retron-type reverse transcriptase